ncbi:hypothetical protein DV704_06355 [Meiothermus sp. QL-1]|uniref:hypothetical protein n=1 Tax=Meiothermus sp. QL-1 TaxID=2058095 RepID=UPI000E0BF3D3|nr:hypothetical protein [Meiothermus sp. QL-1]RDI95500.1 hypothetical protein DV704_06355 [Meiothermus sp. QL-1]
MIKLLLFFTLPFMGGKEEYQVLVALGCSAPRGVQNGYREMLAEEVLPRLSEKLLNASLRLTLAPVTGRSYTAPIRVLETPDALNTPRFKLERFKKTFHQEALKAFDGLRQRAIAECTRGTEIVAALKAAGERARGKGRILLLVHGFEQSELVNLYDYTLKLERPEVRRKLLERVRQKLGLPNLKDQEVCFAGLTAGDDRNANARLTTSIRAFWEELVQASGGRLVGYGASPRVCGFW